MQRMEASLVFIVAVLACVVSQPLQNTTGTVCNGNNDCRSDQICVKATCADPCEGMCGVNAYCVSKDHPPMCSCKPGFNGDPLVECEPPGDEGCTENAECPADRACVNRRCVDPCQGFCGLNTECRVKSHRPICACLRMFSFAQGEGCTPISVPECLTNSNCPEDLSCRQQKCVDACQEDVCGNNTICSVKNHFPVCACKVGYVGDALHECVPFCPAKEKETSYVIVNDHMSWFDAFDYCISNNMSLATVKDEKEWKSLLHVWRAEQLEQQSFWLGGHDLGRFRNMVWASTGNHLTYTNWDQNEPSGEDYHCLEVHGNLHWWSRDCSISHVFACEIR